MPIDTSIYDRLITPVKQPESPVEILQGVANLRDTQAMSQERQALAQEQQQAVQQKIQDARENSQMQAALTAAGGDIEKAYPAMQQINGPKADQYLDAHYKVLDFSNKLQNEEFQKRAHANDFGAQQLAGIDKLPPDQQQHAYDVARASIQASRQLLHLPPVTDDEMDPVYDPAKVQKYLMSSAATQKLLGQQAEATLKPYSLNGQTIMARETKDGHAWYQGRDVTDDPGLQPVDKSGDEKVQGAEIEAIKAWKREHPGQEPTQKDIDLIHRGFKEAGTVVRVDTGAGQAVADVKEAVKGMVEGTIPPQLPGRASKEFTALMAESHRQGFNLVKANEDWQATQKYLGTLNGNQQTTLRQSVDMVEGSVPVVRSLIKQWDSSGLPVLSAATLKAAQAGAFGPAQQSLANRLEGQIADMTSALGTVYKGGNSSTDQSLALAAKNLQGSWSKQAALDALDQIGVNINIRKHSLRLPPVANESNPYTPNLGASAPVKRQNWVFDASGKLVPQ